MSAPEAPKAEPRPLLKVQLGHDGCPENVGVLCKAQNKLSPLESQSFTRSGETFLLFGLTYCEGPQ